MHGDCGDDTADPDYRAGGDGESGPEASKPADEKPKPTTAADLYAMSPKRRREHLLSG